MAATSSSRACRITMLWRDGLFVPIDGNALDNRSRFPILRDLAVAKVVRKNVIRKIDGFFFLDGHILESGSSDRCKVLFFNQSTCDAASDHFCRRHEGGRQRHSDNDIGYAETTSRLQHA